MNKYDELLKKVKSDLRAVKKVTCRKCRDSKKPIFKASLCEECYSDKEAERIAARATKVNESNGYEYVYDADGKSVPKHRFLMEQHLGRKLHKHEVVLFWDGNKRNFDITNLVLAFKHGIPLHQIHCQECGSVGKVSLLTEHTYEPPELPLVDLEFQQQPDLLQNPLLGT